MNVNLYCVVLLSAACCCAHCSFDNYKKQAGQPEGKRSCPGGIGIHYFQMRGWKSASACSSHNLWGAAHWTNMTQMWACSKNFLTCHYEKSIKNYLLFISCNVFITWVNCLMTQQVNCDGTQKNSYWMLLLQMQANKNVKHSRIMCLQQIWAIICKLKKKTKKWKAVVAVVDYWAQSICSHDTDICIYLSHDFFHDLIIRKSISELMIHWTTHGYGGGTSLPQ